MMFRSRSNSRFPRISWPKFVKSRATLTLCFSVEWDSFLLPFHLFVGRVKIKEITDLLQRNSVKLSCE